MPVPFINFRPCSYHKGKDCFVYYYALNPETEKLQRIKIRVNHIHKSSDRDKYARLLCHTIDEKLWSGWNPFVESMSAKALSISQCVQKFLEAKQKLARPATMRSYKSFSQMFLDYLRNKQQDKIYCFQVTRDHLLRYLEWVDDKVSLSNRSYNNYSSFLFTLFDFFVQRGYIKDNPASDFPKRRVDKKFRVVIPPADRKKILAWFDEHIPIYKYVMLLCYLLLIRPKEIMMLRVGYIDFDEQVLRIPSNVAKNHCERELALPNEIMEYFSTLQGLPSEWYIFSGAHSFIPGPKYTAPTRIAERWKEMREALGLPTTYQFYSLKDTGITEMLEAGVPAKLVKELADHSSLEMTEKYTHKSNAKKILEYNTLKF